MPRLRLYDLRYSRLPKVIGACAADLVTVAEAVNAAQQRLLYCKEAGPEGWFGTWAEMAFTINRDQPYLTCPRSVARLEQVMVCEQPVPIQNQFYEYLQFGNGRMPKTFATRYAANCLPQVYSRNNVPTFVDLSTKPQYLAVYPTDPADAERRVFFQGTDTTGQPVYSYAVAGRVGGVYVLCAGPFTIATAESGSAIPWTALTGVQKDITQGPVRIVQIDPDTGAQVTLLTMEAGEEVASYRRYYFNQLPASCCGGSTSTDLTLTAIAKLELIPVAQDTDYTLLQNAEAIIEEAAAIRYRQADTTTAKSMASDAHKNAVRFLNGELAHYLGQDEPAIIFAPFGNAPLSKRRVGSLI